MKTSFTKILIFSLLIVSAVSCTKKDDPLPTQVVNLDTKGVHDITAISAVVDAKAKANCTERGVCWGKAPNPTLDDFHIANGSGKGEYSCTLTDLEPNQKYYYRAYAADGERIAYALDEKSFTTRDGMPVATTSDVSDITATSAKFIGKVTDDGGLAVTERGFCWSTNPNPTFDNAEHLASGNGMGDFSITLTDLTLNTTYYVRAYATSSIGISYAQDEKSFATKNGIILLSTGNVSNITDTSAKCSGNITDDGGFAVTERGVCYGTSPNPTLENAQHVVAGSGTGEFSVTLTGLEKFTKYYVRAYATNSHSTRYGSDANFTPGFLTFTIDNVKFTMIPVDGGTFTMGATSEQGSDASYCEKPTHSVTLSSFYMGETEVTQALWRAVMGNNPSYYSGSNRPVESVSWNDCQEFIAKLNQLCASQLDGRRFRLPTEAEWEYAARGGTKSKGYKYSGSNTVGNVAWYVDNSSSSHTVGAKQPNELGLYDMSGNVWEWCSDWFSDTYYSSSPQNNPTGPSTGLGPVFRGGGWFSIAVGCRVSHRTFMLPSSNDSSVGLRLVVR